MKTILTFSFALALLVAMPAAAQQDDNDTRQDEHAMMMDMPGEGMMQGMQTCMMMMQAMHAGAMMNGMQGAGMQGAEMGGGMTGMMQQPMHRAMMLVHMLPTMQEPLNLDEGQVDLLNGLHENLMASHAELAERIKETRSELNDLLAQEGPDASRVESLLKAAAEVRAEIQASMFATSLQMKNVLSAEQKAALAEMQPADMHRHMMQNMSMMEMMQMMNKMHGGMMDGGMVDQGSMQRDETSRGQHEQHHR